MEKLIALWSQTPKLESARYFRFVDRRNHETGKLDMNVHALRVDETTGKIATKVTVPLR